MITLTINVPNAAAVVQAGFTQLQVLKSTTQTEAGPYTALPSPLTLDAAATTYSYVDPGGGYGDWYETEYLAGGTPSQPSAPWPGYLSDLNNTVRDLLGVTTNEVSDTQIQGFAYLPTALSRVRARLATNALVFDTVVAGGGDASAAGLGALAHLTAGLLCPRMTIMVVDSEQFKDYKYQRNRQMDWGQTQCELLAQYEILISQAAGETAANLDLQVTGALVTGPTSSGQDTSGGLAAFSADAEANPLLPYTQNPPYVP